MAAHRPAGGDHRRRDQQGEIRSDTLADLFALATAGLTDRALAQHWASDGTPPSLTEIPVLVLTLLVVTGARGMSRETPRRALMVVLLCLLAARFAFGMSANF